MEFELSDNSKLALGALPEGMRGLAAKDALALSTILPLTDEPGPGDLPEGWDEIVDLAFALKWTNYAGVDDAILGRKMPVSEDLR